MENKEKKYSRRSAPERSARMVETIFGCKWSLTVYRLLADGVIRPGQMVRQVEGLSTKVLNECLRKIVFSDVAIINTKHLNFIQPFAAAFRNNNTFCLQKRRYSCF